MAKAWRVKGLRRKRSVLFNARRIMAVRLSELYSWDAAVRDPSHDEALHGMRISAKRLRYAMEFYSPCFGSEYQSHITTVEQIQKLLGEVHDCSVMIAFLQNYLETGVAARGHRSGRRRPDNDQTAIRDLIAARTAARDELYRTFINFWDARVREDFQSRLLNTLKTNAR